MRHRNRTEKYGVLVGLYTFFSPSTIYILFPYSFRILVPNRVYILEYANNTAPNRAYILKYSLYSREKSLKIASKKNIERVPLVCSSIGHTAIAVGERGDVGRQSTLLWQRAPRSCTVFVMTPPNDHSSEGG